MADCYFSSSTNETNKTQKVTPLLSRIWLFCYRIRASNSPFKFYLALSQTNSSHYHCLRKVKLLLAISFTSNFDLSLSPNTCRACFKSSIDTPDRGHTICPFFVSIGTTYPAVLEGVVNPTPGGRAAWGVYCRCHQDHPTGAIKEGIAAVFRGMDGRVGLGDVGYRPPQGTPHR